MTPDIVSSSRRARGVEQSDVDAVGEGVDLMPVALHGWGHAQTDPELLATLCAALVGFRERCVPVIEQWQAEGVVAADADPKAVAQLLLSICLGFVAQRSLTGDADIKAHAAALAALRTAAEAGEHNT
jgi:hypothetical protein